MLWLLQSGPRAAPEERLTPQERVPAHGVFRFASMRAHASDAPPLVLGPGLNVLSGVSHDDLRLLRTVFEALTGAAAAGLDAIVEVDGTRMALDAEMPRLHGLVGHSPPIVEVPAGSLGAAGPGYSGPGYSGPGYSGPGYGGPGHGGPGHGGPGTGSEGSGAQQATGRADPAHARLAELRSLVRGLRSELELTQRELDRQRELDTQRELGVAPDPGVSGGAGLSGDAGLHPADVAAICDRLRDLLAGSPPPEATRLADELDEARRHRVYRIHREDALDQLMAECRAAVRSASEYLESVAGRDDAGSGGEGGGEVSFEAHSLEAHTIARLDLLEELARFWEGRLAELRSESADQGELLARANEVLVARGGLPSGSHRDAAARLRDLAAASGADRRAVDELAGILAGYLGLDPSSMTVEELLERAEQRLANGTDAGTQNAPATPHWPQPDPDRLVELESAERRLVDRLARADSELEALERSAEAARQALDATLDAGDASAGTPQAAPSRASGANPFGDKPASPSGGTRPADEAAWSFTDAIIDARAIPGVGVLPVLIVEPNQTPHGLTGVDPMSVASMGLGGQVVWVTDRPEVTDGLAVLVDDVRIIGG